MKNNLIRGIRKASRLPDGAAAHRRVQARRAARTCRCGCRRVVIGGGLTGDRHRDRAARVLPAAGREDRSTRYETLVGRAAARRRCARRYDAEEREIARRVPRARARGARRARRARRRPARRPTSSPLVARVGRRHDRLPQAHGRLAGLSPEPRGGRARRSRRASRFVENLSPDRGGARRARRAQGECSRSRTARKGGRRRSTLPARTRVRRRGHDARTSPTRRSTPGTFELDAKKQFFQPLTARRAATARLALEPPTATETASSRRYQRGRHDSSRFYGDNHPRYAGNVVKAMASAKDGYPHVAALFARELAGARRRRRSRRATRAWRALVAQLDDELSPRRCVRSIA